MSTELIGQRRILALHSIFKKVNRGLQSSGMVAQESSVAVKAGGQAAPGRVLEGLEFDNVFAQTLPRDPNTENRVRKVEGALLTPVKPTPTNTEPKTIVASPAVAKLIGLDSSEFDRPEFSLVFSGNSILPGSEPYAQCYGGHQFGNWAGQLGDGRAISLGEVKCPENRGRWELQLKGAGRTPYSRMADGRAVLRSSLREYVASEAMSSLGIPTTRALSLVSTGDEVLRDMFYNGNAQMEPGAVVCRVARSFIRFGSFQLPASRGDYELVRKLADFVIKEYYPDAQEAKNRYAAFLKTVAEKTGFLIAEWNRVGFVHGVLNTDNMSILGDTIDYGPYGWLERFDPNFTPNTTDLPGRRYCFQSQPEIGQWNIVQLARALVASNLMSEEEAADAIAAYGQTLVTAYNHGMSRKLGMKAYDADLVNQLLVLMYESDADYTNTFRALGNIDITAAVEGNTIPNRLLSAFGDGFNEEKAKSWIDWMKRYNVALQAEMQDETSRRAIQNDANPAIIPRNHVIVDIISEAEEGNYTPLLDYMRALERPYHELGLNPDWSEPAPSKARLGVELLSCSS